MPALDVVEPTPRAPAAAAKFPRVIGPDPVNIAQVLCELPEHPGHVCAVHLGAGTWQCQDCDASDSSLWASQLEAAPTPEVAEEAERLVQTAADLLDEVPEDIAWHVPGFVAPGFTTMFAAAPKAGKGNLVMCLLGCLERGEDTVFGPGPGRPVKSLILTEEPRESMREKIESFGLTQAGIIAGYKLAGDHWPAKVEKLIDAALDLGAGVVFVDNISRAAGIEDENGTEFARAVEILSDQARRHGLACIVDHHHKKGWAADLQDKARGGSALRGLTEVNVQMVKVPADDPLTRCRKLVSEGRSASAMWSKTIELSADGTDYHLVGDGSGTPTGKADKLERGLLAVLEEDGGWLNTTALKARADGRSTALGEAIRAMAASSAWPVTTRKVGQSVEYKYDPAAQAAFIAEATG